MVIEMSSILERLNLCLYWYNRPLLGREYLDQIKEFLLFLRERFERFSDLYIVKSSGSSTIKIESDFANFEMQVISNLPKQRLYSNVDPSIKHFISGCTCKMGFSNSFSTAPYGDHSACIIELAIGIADERIANSVIFRFPMEEESTSFYIELFKQSILFWRPKHGALSRGRFDLQLDQPIEEIGLGWITYFPTTDAINYLPRGVEYEPFSNGLLIRLSHEVPEVSDPSILPSLNKLRQSLEKQGFLKCKDW